MLVYIEVDQRLGCLKQRTAIGEDNFFFRSQFYKFGRACAETIEKAECPLLYVRYISIKYIMMVPVLKFLDKFKSGHRKII